MTRVDQNDGSEYYPPVSLPITIEGGSAYGQPDQNILDLLGTLKKGSRILELGSGDGRYTFAMVEKGLDVVATDYQASARDALFLRRGQLKSVDQKKVFILDQSVNAFGHLPFTAKSFDAVVVTGFLYLFPEEMIREVFEEAGRVLRQKGKLIFDFATDLQRIHDDGRELKGQDEMHYSFHQGYGIINQLLEDTGFQIENNNRSISFIREHVPAGYTISNTKINILADKK